MSIVRHISFPIAGALLRCTAAPPRLARLRILRTYRPFDRSECPTRRLWFRVMPRGPGLNAAFTCCHPRASTDSQQTIERMTLHSVRLEAFRPGYKVSRSMAKGICSSRTDNSSTITVYGAPTIRQACGKIIGMIQDSFSQPTDAASLNAVTGRIVVAANQEVDVCSLRHGCTKRLNAPFLNFSASIAVSHDGDCWAEADEASGPGVLYYFKGCNSDGQLTSGFYGGGDNYGGLDIDKYGNIVSIFANFHNTPAVYVYSGCNPTCAPVSGPLPLVGNGTYGHLNKDSTAFAVADTQFSSIDVYKFTPTSLRFEYSFNGGLSGIEGVAYNPRAK